jgi:steroid delta-isomerase-like uncharacterized protein
VNPRDLASLLTLIESGFNSDDLDRLDAVLHPDLVVHAPIPAGTGREDFKETLAAIRRGFPDGHITIEDLAVEPDRVFRRWTFQGTHRGDFIGIPATGRTVRMSGVDVERFQGGVIVEHWSFWDRLQLLEQLGVAPGQEPG